MKPEGAPGQQKTHKATRINQTTGQTEQREFTQEEWRNRDKSEGWVREDETEENEEPETPA